MSPAIERCIKPLVDEFSPGSFRERYLSDSRLDAMREQRDAAEQECERLKADLNLALDRLHEAAQ